jgi:hypothetical protein
MVVDGAAKWGMAVCGGDDILAAIARWEGVPGTAWAHQQRAGQKNTLFEPPDVSRETPQLPLRPALGSPARAG